MSANSAPNILDTNVARLTTGLIVLLASFLLSGCMSTHASACPQIRPLTDLFAVYEVVAVEKYRGGFTSQTQAESLIGTQVEISMALFRMVDETITQPRYQIRCHTVPAEGEVSTDRWSTFYGYGIDRHHVEVLDVSRNEGAYPEYLFEVISPQELWRLHDGWLYRLHPRLEN
jgi:hypothetical protein